MHRLLSFIRTIGSVAGLVLAATLVASAQGAPPSPDDRTAEQVYKNIKALKGTPANQLNQSMHLIKGALGVDCLYCHIEREWEKDVKPPKAVATAMISMMMDINKRDFGGRQVVTCNTCHNGRPVPADMPVFPVLEPKEPVKPVMPTVDQILTKYVQALGGEQAIRKVTSRLITGTQYIPTGPGGTTPMPAMVERYQKAPGVNVTIYRTPTYAIAQGFDGTTAWAQDQAGRVSDAVTLDTRRAKRTSDFYEPLTLKQQYAQLTVKGIEKVNDHDAYVVIGVPQGDSNEWLYFDTQSGLLLRKVTVLPTPAGNSPFQTDFDDYRDTGSGVKVPFLIQMNPSTPRTELAPNATLRVTKVQDNAPIEDSKLARPASRAAPAR
jgi:photosynthetic reaction center cytochrome c subunit